MFEHCIRSRVEEGNPKKRHLQLTLQLQLVDDVVESHSVSDRMTFDDEISEHRINSAIIYCRLFLLFLNVENEIKTAYLYSATIT